MKLRERGYWGIAFYEPKCKENIGLAVRSANCFGCNFISIIGKRYSRHPTDTMRTERHIPIYEYTNLDDFLKHLPINCEVIGIEIDGKKIINNFRHPERAIYIFGGEDRMLPKKIKNRIKINTKYCLNMAIASSIIMYDRQLEKK